MKQSKTTLKELTAAYRAVLRHGILCNAIALGLIAATPALADPANTSGNAFVFGDVAISEQHTIDKTAFGGRRMEWKVILITENKESMESKQISPKPVVWWLVGVTVWGIVSMFLIVRSFSIYF